MTPKEKVWFFEYLRSLNATKAARKAGYKWPQQQGHQKREKFRDEIQDALDELLMPSREALNRLARIARFDVSDYLIVDTAGAVSVDVRKMQASGDGDLIRSINKAGLVAWANPDHALGAILKAHEKADQPSIEDAVVRVKIIDYGLGN